MLHVFWEKKDKNERMFAYSRSEDNGMTWSEPKEVIKDEFSMCAFPIATATNRNLTSIVIGTEIGIGSKGFGAKIFYSKDHGDKFSFEEIASERLISCYNYYHSGSAVICGKKENPTFYSMSLIKDSKLNYYSWNINTMKGMSQTYPFTSVGIIVGPRISCSTDEERNETTLTAIINVLSKNVTQILIAQDKIKI